MKYIYIPCMLLLLFANLHSQPQDNNFQRFYAQVQTALAKDVESINQEDLKILRDAAKLTPEYFGAANQQLVSKMIQDTKAKIREHDSYLKSKDDHQRTQSELTETSEAYKQSEARGDSLFAENVQLKALIDQLTIRVEKLDKEAKNLQTINRRYHQENVQTKELLESSRNALKRIFNILPVANQRNELFEQIPGSLNDSLNQSECQIAELLKDNFVLTLDGLKSDVAFVDSASKHFVANRVHLPMIDDYIGTGLELSTKLKSIGSPCTMNYAAEIEIAIQEFRSAIESSVETSFMDRFSSFVSNNSGIVIALLLIVSILIIFLFVRSKKK